MRDISDHVHGSLMDGGDDGEIQLVVGDFGELTEVRFSDTVQIKKVPW